LLADQQKKHSDSYQQGKQNTDGERNNPMTTRLDLFRSGALLRRSETQPEEKFVHRTLLSTSYHRQGAADDGHRRLLRARPERPPTAAPPSSVMNSRRPQWTAMWPSRGRSCPRNGATISRFTPWRS